jgi:prolyl-tRNA synthetase
MRMSEMLARPAKDAPKGAPLASHRLLAQGGFVRETAPGLYALLPLGRRVLARAEALARAAAGARGFAELALPALQDDAAPAGGPGYALKDRRGAALRLGGDPAAALLRLAAREISSYKQLPLRFCQVGARFRDGGRARWGLFEARESLALQAWAMAVAAEDVAAAVADLRALADDAAQAAGVAGRWVDGGPAAAAWVAMLDGGPVEILACPACGDAALAETAASRLPEHPQDSELRPMEAVCGPGLVQPAPLAEFLGIPVWKTSKTLLFLADGRPVAVMVRGDGGVSEAKVRRRLGCARLELAPPETVRARTGAEVGYAGPIGLPAEVLVLADAGTRARVNFECGANRTDHHLINVNFSRDLPLPEFGDYLAAEAGHGCSRCPTGRLERGAGVVLAGLTAPAAPPAGAPACACLDRDGRSRPVELAHVELNLTALAAAVAEQRHDAAGIAWPPRLAPAAVHLVALNLEEPEVARAAADLYASLQAEGLAVLFDDRDARAGDKFAAADLLGVPAVLTLSRRSLQAGELELKRRGGEREALPCDLALARLRQLSAE